MSGLGKILGDFDYVTETQLPAPLVQAMNEGGQVFFEGDSYLEVVQRERLWTHDFTIRADYNEKHPTDDPGLICLFLQGFGQRWVYYDREGKRVGDDLTVPAFDKPAKPFYDWMPKGPKTVRQIQKTADFVETFSDVLTANLIGQDRNDEALLKTNRAQFRGQTLRS